MASVFKVKKPEAADVTGIEATGILEILPPVSEEDDNNNDTTNLLLIPISDEIAPDFVLYGYDATVRRIEDILTQRGKQRNIMLHGDQGIGKTAVIHGLVQRKNNNDLSTHMYKRVFHRLNTSRLLHTDDVSEINKSFDQALQELGYYDVLVIENFATFVTYLKTKGANFLLVNLLESLSRRKFQSIITCNSREKISISNEVPEIHEYFFPEKLSEPNDDELLNILYGVHHAYENRYGVSIDHEALRSIRDLTQKYRQGLEGWAQPGRMLLLLDRSISQFSVTMNSKPQELSDLESQAEVLKNEIDVLTPLEGAFLDNEDRDRIDELAAKLTKIEPKIESLRTEWEKTTTPIRDIQAKKVDFERRKSSYIKERQKLLDKKKDNAALIEAGKDITGISTEIESYSNSIRITNEAIKKFDYDLSKINLSAEREHTVTIDDIAKTFSELSGISVKQLTENDKERVRNMETILGERVFGQEEAITAIAVAVRRAKANLSDDEGTPKGSFLFLGPSGTGKTELGKALAEYDTGSEKNMVRIDMSEFMEKHSVSRLIGAPPGYAGYEEGGVLTNAVHAHPKSIVMFDEVEKAHQDVFKILLQVLGDGRLTDGQGMTVDFRETYVIMTSNLGTSYFLDESLSYEQAAKEAMCMVQKFFAPEFLGRLDSIVCFHRLELSLLEKVAMKRVGSGFSIRRPRHSESTQGNS